MNSLLLLKTLVAVLSPQDVEMQSYFMKSELAAAQLLAHQKVDPDFIIKSKIKSDSDTERYIYVI